MTGANFSNWYSQSEGTVFTEFTPSASAGIQHLFAVSDGTGNNRIQQFRSGTAIQNRIVAGGVQTNPGNVATSNQSVTAKTAIAYKVGKDQGAAVLSGGSVNTSSPAASPVVTLMALGQNHLVSNFEMLNGHIKRIAYFPRRLADTELQSITS
jgi:hypothetical protein